MTGWRESAAAWGGAFAGWVTSWFGTTGGFAICLRFAFREFPAEHHLAIRLADEMGAEGSAFLGDELLDESGAAFREETERFLARDLELAEFLGEAGLRLAEIVAPEDRFAGVGRFRFIDVRLAAGLRADRARAENA